MHFIEIPVNFKISWTSNFGSDFSGKLCET